MGVGWAGEGGKVRKNEEARPSRPEQVCGSAERGRSGMDASKKGQASVRTL